MATVETSHPDMQTRTVRTRPQVCNAMPYCLIIASLNAVTLPSILKARSVLNSGPINATFIAVFILKAKVIETRVYISASYQLVKLHVPCKQPQVPKGQRVSRVVREIERH